MINDNDTAGFQEGVRRVKQEVENAEKSGNFRIYSTDMAKVYWGKKN
jgi:hypothetical protein